ncbi:unnamed protein product [Musa acuminata subsp. burmannicoides]
MPQDQRKKNSPKLDFFSEYGNVNRYKIQEVIGKGSYGVVCSAVDTQTGEKVAIKKINNIFEHKSDAARILREIKLLRLLRHPDIVEIKHILLPPSTRNFKDIYVVFELMESDLHEVIKVNDDLTSEHYRFFLYQLLRALKYIHAANVYHRDLKPKNILANANCKLKICDFGLARVAFNDAPTTIYWTDYVATRWYRAPELCGSFFGKYTPAVDIWSIGCIFAEILTGKPLFPGKNVVHQLELMTDLLGAPSIDTISKICNEKAKRYLSSMSKKQPLSFAQKFPNADPLALGLLKKLLAFDPKDRPSAEEALTDPYFKGLAKVEREPSRKPIRKMEFEFEQLRLTKEEIQELIFREILEYHPKLLSDHLNGMERAKFLYPSAIDKFTKQFAHLEENGNRTDLHMLDRKHVSLPRSTVVHCNAIPPKEESNRGSLRKASDLSNKHAHVPERLTGYMERNSQACQRIPTDRLGKVVGSVMLYDKQSVKVPYDSRQLIPKSVHPPQPAIPMIPMACCFCGTLGKSEISNKDPAETKQGYTQHNPLQQSMSSKIFPDNALDLRSTPSYLPGGAKADPSKLTMMDTSPLQPKLPFNGIAAATAAAATGAHRNVCMVQRSVSRMS